MFLLECTYEGDAFIRGVLEADATNEFIGEDVIQHTPKDEELLIDGVPRAEGDRLRAQAQASARVSCTMPPLVAA